MGQSCSQVSTPVCAHGECQVPSCRHRPQSVVRQILGVHGGLRHVDHNRRRTHASSVSSALTTMEGRVRSVMKMKVGTVSIRSLPDDDKPRRPKSRYGRGVDVWLFSLSTLAINPECAGRRRAQWLRLYQDRNTHKPSLIRSRTSATVSAAISRFSNPTRHQRRSCCSRPRRARPAPSGFCSDRGR